MGPPWTACLNDGRNTDRPEIGCFGLFWHQMRINYIDQFIEMLYIAI